MVDSRPLVTISGEVERPARLTDAELESLADAELVADFHCREGWSRVGERWRGVRLSTLLALVGVRNHARYVTVAAGEYTVVLTRTEAEADHVLLALQRQGAPGPRRRDSRAWSVRRSGTAFKASSRSTGSS